VVQSSVATHVQVHRVTDREELRPSAVSWDLPAVVGRASPDHLRTGSTGSTRESVLMLANDDPPVADEDSTRSPASMNGYSSARPLSADACRTCRPEWSWPTVPRKMTGTARCSAEHHPPASEACTPTAAPPAQR
jgi:hypothetical protein